MTITTDLVRYDMTEAQLATLSDRFTGLSCETPQAYEATRLAIGELREIRVAVEARRVELKADALAFGRAVDAEAKRITGRILAIEGPLKALKEAVDEEKERQRLEAVEAKRRELEAQVAAAREAEEARLRAIREVEARALAEERRRLDAERAALAAERAEQDARDAATRRQEAEARAIEEARLRAERAALEAERLEVRRVQEQAERVEFQRQAVIRAERDAIEHAERERIETARRAQELQALLPDVDKARAFAVAIRALTPPSKVKNKKVIALVTEACAGLTKIATALDAGVKRL